jgi:hypothetical protein
VRRNEGTTQGRWQDLSFETKIKPTLSFLLSLFYGRVREIEICDQRKLEAHMRRRQRYSRLLPARLLPVRLFQARLLQAIYRARQLGKNRESRQLFRKFRLATFVYKLERVLYHPVENRVWLLNSVYRRLETLKQFIDNVFHQPNLCTKLIIKAMSLCVSGESFKPKA